MSADVTVKLVQDEIPEIDLAVVITAGAANNNSSNATILVTDDDVPGLELVLQTTTVSESAGFYATQATLRRKAGSNAIAFTANLSANLANTLILPASVSLAKGENEKTFNVGVIDNTLADGQRTVSVTAAILVSSCGCSAPSASAGSVSADLTVNDNDGPSLQLTAAQITLAEGAANAGLLRVSRNTSTAEALTVNLSSSDTNEARLPVTTVIPAGQVFIDVPITTINDGIPDGNKQVYLQATAGGFSTGTIWVLVSDQNKPDLQIPAVKLTNANVQALAIFNYQFSVKNSGFSTAPAGVVVRGYLSLDNIVDDSDKLISEDTLSTAIAAGQTVQILNAVKAPDLPGQYILLFKVNPDASLTELLVTNNTSAPVSLLIKPDYTATASVNLPYFVKGSSIPVTGTATMSTGTPAANAQVEVFVITSGIRRKLLVTTNGSGQYSTQFVPLANEAGHYTVGAGFPGLNDTTAQDAFDILGVRISGGNIPQFKVTLNDTLTGLMPVQNVSNKALTHFVLVPLTLPGGALIRFDTVALLAGNATANIPFRIIGTALSGGNNYDLGSLQAVAMKVLFRKRIYFTSARPHRRIFQQT